MDGQECDWLPAPGVGLTSEDRILASVSGKDGRFLRIRFSIEGVDSARGAVTEVDYFDYIERNRLVVSHRKRPALPRHHDRAPNAKSMNQNRSTLRRSTSAA